MTRMWVGVDPSALCDQHLLGEHSELHQEVGTWLRHPHGEAVVAGHVEKAQVIPRHIRRRHERLAEELARRDMDHDSPLEDFDADAMPTSDAVMAGVYMKNGHDLADRCADCREGLQG